MKPSCDAILIAPGNHKALFQNLATEYTAIEPPVWAGLLTKALRVRGFTVELLDQAGLGMDTEALVARVKSLQPRLVALVVYGHQPSASTQTMTAAMELGTLLKQSVPETKLLFLGGHPSALPKRTLEESGADFVCQGEGVHTLEALLQQKPLREVPGLWFKEEGNIISTAPAALIPGADLSKELPGVAWESLPMQNYRAHNWHCFDHIEERSPYAAIYTSLGCPFHCSFCCINAPFGRNTIRYWEPEFILREIDVLVTQYGVKNLKIVDEMFVLHESHVTKLCEGIIERGYQLNIWAYARVDTVKDSLLAKMRAAGVRWLCLGIESGSKHVRQGVEKGRFGHEDIYKTVKKIQDAGIHVIGNFIFGLPDDTLESMRDTLRLALDLDLEFANFYSAMAYPGSQLYNLAVEKGWRLPEKWQDFSQHSFECLPLPTESLAAGAVLAFRDQAWQHYFTHPRYLKKVEQKFGPQVVEHLQKLSEKNLTRKFALQEAVLGSI